MTRDEAEEVRALARMAAADVGEPEDFSLVEMSTGDVALSWAPNDVLRKAVRLARLARLPDEPVRCDAHRTGATRCDGVAVIDALRGRLCGSAVQ